MSFQSSDVRTFENVRIQALRQERLSVQQKTFTKWVNSYLGKVNCRIDDVFRDFEDGRLLLKLLELISGERMGTAKPARLRVQKVENVNKALRFLSTKVRLESIGPEDIVDGNPRLILGLMWTIILRFEIQEIQIQGADSAEIRSAKEALLLWCQRQTAGYNDVKIKNFSSSWRNGLALCALLHANRPDLIDYKEVQKMTTVERLNTAFDIAHKHLGISKLLDAEDVDIERPDEKSIITYVSAFYHYFAKMKSGETGKKRIVKILSKLQEVQTMISDYERLVTDLLEWIAVNTRELSDHRFPNSLLEIKKEIVNFKLFRTEQKPPKYKVWTEIEAIWFEIQSKARDCRCKAYLPPEKKSIHDIERAWKGLEKEEYQREVAIREELMRQEKLHRLAENFERKAMLRESWIADISTVLQESVIPNGDVQMLEACIKRHEAITADIMSRRGRFESLSQMAKELISQNYEDSSAISLRDKDISMKWQELMDLLAERQKSLEGFSDLIGLLREMDAVVSEMDSVEVTLQSSDYGKHLQAVEGLLERHGLIEVQIKSQGSQINQILQVAETYMESKHRESKMIKKRTVKLTEMHQRTKDLSDSRKTGLEASLNFFRFLQDEDEMDAWIMEKQRLAKSMVAGRDMRSVLLLKQKHSILETEIKGGQVMYESISREGMKLIKNKHADSKIIAEKLSTLEKKMQTLKTYADARRHRLNEASEAHQYFIDINEADSWVREKMPMVCSDDYGKDSPSAQRLTQHHQALVEEIQAYENDIKKLAVQARSLVSKYKQFQENTVDAEGSTERDDGIEVKENDKEKMKMKEIEVLEEVVEEKRYQQVKALYKYEAYGMKVARGEVMVLLSKRNAEWWEVRCISGKQGFIPANYVKEVAPKIVRNKVQKKVKKQVEIPRDENGNSPKKKTKFASQAKRKSLVDGESIAAMQKRLESTYVRLKKLAQVRKMYLLDSIKLFTFYRECDEFETWMCSKEKLLKRKERMSDKMEAARRHFENLVIDLQANQSRLERINKMADEFVYKGHSKQIDARKRQKEVNDQWEKLWKMKDDMENLLDGASSIEMYNQSWGETKEWILEKLSAIAENYPTTGNQTKENLQRKLESVEQEIMPVQEKLRKLGILATAVKSSYPTEVGHINECQDRISQLWDVLQQKTENKKADLEEARNIASFETETKQLMSWTMEVKSQLMDTQSVKDVQGCEDLIGRHLEVLADVEVQKERFEKALSLAKQIPDVEKIHQKVQMLSQVPEELLKNWDKRNKQLEDALDLAMFNKEADQIEAESSGHEVFLEFDELGTSVREIEALKKRHENFQETLQMQEKKMAALQEMADNLIQKGHNSKNFIKSRVHDVSERRRHLKLKAEKRQEKIEDRRAFVHFKRDAEEVASWIKDKVLVAADDSYQDLSCLPSKLTKHEAFEAELVSHATVLGQLNQAGRKLIESKNSNSHKVEEELASIGSSWKKLHEMSSDKGNKLRQSLQEVKHGRGVEDVLMTLEEITAQLSSGEIGDSLRSVRNLIKRHEDVNKKFNDAGKKFGSLQKEAERMKKDGHYHSDNIAMATETLSNRYKELLQPLKDRELLLKDSLAGQEFRSLVESEHQWINERLPAMQNSEVAKDFRSSQSLTKKFEKLKSELANHEPVVKDCIKEGQKLIKQEHFASEEIKDSLEHLLGAWKELLDLGGKREQAVQMNFRVQQYLLDASEVELWCSDKLRENFHQEFGKDETTTSKLLRKSKALEEELQCQEEIIANLQKRVDGMIDEGNPEVEMVVEKQVCLENLLMEVANSVSDWRSKLEMTQLMHRYMRDSDELGEWIEERYQAASSEEYGQDYEHMQMLWDEFVNFKKQVEKGLEIFSNCEEQAKILSERSHPDSHEVTEKQNSLKQALQMLMEQVIIREQRLQAAGEMHQFRCMYDDVTSRIQEKNALLSDELGKGVDSVQSLIRKHETFTTDLVALSTQLDNLLKSGSDLDEEYPDVFSDQLTEMQESVVDKWNQLQGKTDRRGSLLQAALDYHTFLATFRDLVEWSQEMKTEMEVTDDAACKSVAAADDALRQHKELRVEMAAREDNFTSLMEAGTILIQQQHYANEEIADKLESVTEAREELLTKWEVKREMLDQLQAEQVFLRDVEQLHTISSQQEALLSTSDFGDSVEQVDAAIKKQEAFDKILAVQEEKLSAVQKHQHTLPSSEHTNNKLTEITQRRSNIKDKSLQRREKLNQAKLYAQFRENITEARLLISEKQKVLESYGSFESSLLQEKLKKLKKHQAFEAELTANDALITEIKQIGEKLQKIEHPKKEDVAQDVSELLSKWTALRELSCRKGQSLQQLKELLEFQRQTERVDLWIREKTALVAFGDVGDDYEHCLELQRKLDNFGQDKSVDDQAVNEISEIARRINEEGPEELADGVKDRAQEIQEKWQVLQKKLYDYKLKLKRALEIHTFNREVQELKGKISEKGIALKSEDVGRTLEGVESLKRRYQGVLNDVQSLETSIKHLSNTGSKLSEKFKDHVEDISASLDEVASLWESLQASSEKRKAMLDKSHELQTFLKNFKNLVDWYDSIILTISSLPLSNKLQDAEKMCESHKELLSDITRKQEESADVISVGERLIEEDHPATAEITSAIDTLRNTTEKVLDTWRERKVLLGQCFDLQVFQDYAKNADSVLSNKESYLAVKDLGDSLTATEHMLKKHLDFEKGLISQLEKVEELRALGSELVKQDHYEKDTISMTCTQMDERQNKVIAETEQRNVMLAESIRLHRYLQNVHEFSSWMAEMSQVTADNSLEKLSNIQRKLKKHQSQEAEIFANQSRLVELQEEGMQMMKEGHFGADDINKELDWLKDSWDRLCSALKLKGERLQHAQKLMTFERNVQDLEFWLQQTKQQLQSTDVGKDLKSASNLMKKHQLLESQMNLYSEKLQNSLELHFNLESGRSPSVPKTDSRILKCKELYQELVDLSGVRRVTLEESISFFQLFRDMKEEMVWIEERLPQARSSEYGEDVNAISQLFKRHKELLQDISTHAKLVEEVINKASKMVEQGHFAALDITTHRDKLEEGWKTLNEEAVRRQTSLESTYELKLYFSEATEALAWLDQKQPSSKVFGTLSDEESLLSLLKRLESLRLDLDAFNHNSLAKLRRDSDNLCSSQPQEMATITTMQEKVEERFTKVKMICKEKESALLEKKSLFNFNHEALSILEWIQEKMGTATSKDVGKDLEHVEILRGRFSGVMEELKAHERNIHKLLEDGEELVKNEVGTEQEISERCQEVDLAWRELKGAANTRTETLARAWQLQAFSSDAQETISWIHEKDSSLSVSMEESGSADLTEVQKMMRKHDRFERDLMAVEEKVNKISSEAGELADKFPDAFQLISDHNDVIVGAWNQLLDKSLQQKERLMEAEQMQLILTDYRDLSSWMQEKLNQFESGGSADTVPEAEELISRHNQHRDEMENRGESISKFIRDGRRLVEEGHSMSQEIAEKMEKLNTQWENLLVSWTERQTYYQEILDKLLLMRDFDQAEKWLDTKGGLLLNDEPADESCNFEDLLKKQEEMEKLIAAQEEKFLSIGSEFPGSSQW